MTTTTQQNRLRLAVLIDADNAQASRITLILDEIAKYGTASVKRIYADWTKSHSNSWKNILLDHSIQPIQQFGYTTGKNATDSALIIDAMDLLYTKNFDGFCIISSDSDFTRLAARIREEGLMVLGFGEQKTPVPFIRSCDRFTYVEILDETESESEPNHIDDQKLAQLIEKAFDSIDNDLEGVNLATFGNTLSQIQPDFDPRIYGYRQLNKLLSSMPDLVDIKRHNNGYIVKRIKANPQSLVDLIDQAIDSLGGQGNDWVDMGGLGSAISKIDPNFKPSQYGFNQLSRLIRSLNKEYQVKRNGKSYLVRKTNNN